MDHKHGNFNAVDDRDDQLDLAKQKFLRDRKMAYVQGMVTVLGESDVLECIGIKRTLEYVQAIGFGPVGPDRRFCRERVAGLAYSFECDDEPVRGIALGGVEW
jgi:hypothetical protein